MPVDPPGVCYLVTTVSHVMLNANKLINTHKLKTVGGIGLICSNDFLYLSWYDGKPWFLNVGTSRNKS